MNVCVIGTGTLAAATAECCAAHFAVTRAPDWATDVLWLCEDTPIQEDGRPQPWSVTDAAASLIGSLREPAVVVVSSQVPVGTTRQLERLFPERTIACVPENIRLKTAVEDFRQQARIVVGVRRHDQAATIDRLLSPFTSTILWTTPETAEMVKHALNAYLGLSIAFINEIARLSRSHAVDMAMVTQALRTERRISPHAPLLAGAPFGGGHLARDIHVLSALAAHENIEAPLVCSILRSNALPT